MNTHRITVKLLLVVSALTPLIWSGPSAPAAEISGVKLPDQVSLDGKSLKLNGAGLRQATILKINVYAAGLYLEKPSGNSETIANSDQSKSIEMAFMRDVSAKQMADAFQEAFDKN